MIYNPNIIVQCLSSQAIYIDKLYGQMFYFTDRRQIWYDTQDKGRIQAYDIVILQYERNRNNFVPNNIRDFPSEPNYQISAADSDLVNYSIVYVVETNSLYKYENNIWTTIYGRYGSTVVAQTYLPDGTIKYVVADDVTTNGILNDGSVVVRDSNKMICGQLSSDGYTFNIQSLIGGCINFNPSGKDSGPGTLQLNANFVDNNVKNSVANLNGDLVVFGKIKTTLPENWNKQYRLVTNNLRIDQNSTIKLGSLIKSGSTLDTIKYTTDTILTEDININSGYIVQDSKLYIGSIINGEPLKPPFLFDDIDSPETATLSLDNSILNINENNSFVNSGDEIFISTSDIDINSITKIKFKNDIEYDIDFIATEGINNTARVVYYKMNNTVKILP